MHPAPRSGVDDRLCMKHPRSLIAAALSLMAAMAGAQPPIHEGQTFMAARQALLKNRWRPIPIHTRPDQANEGVEKRLIKRGIYEFDSCSMDSSRCILFYERRAHCLRVDTIGERVEIMTIVQWSDECPDALPRATE